MLTITIQIKERPKQFGPARKVDVRIQAKGHATTAEEQYGEEFKPILEKMMGAVAIDRTHGKNRLS